MSPFSTGIADPRKKTTFAGGISCLLLTARDQREMVNHMAQEEGSASGPGRKGRGNVERGWLMLIFSKMTKYVYFKVLYNNKFM